MKKILLIEDRVERQKKFTEDTGIKLEEYSDILDNVTSLDKTSLDKYSIIVTHRSAFENRSENSLDFLKKHCETTHTQLVFFSGGISSTYYSKTKFEFLLLNSKSFYNKNLKEFLDDFRDKMNTDKNGNILLLGYGKYWEINIILNTISKINMFISKKENEMEQRENADNMVKLNKFKIDTKIDNISNLISFKYPEVIKGGRVCLEDLKKLANDITNKLRVKVEQNA